MQNLSLLQLLKALSAASANDCGKNNDQSAPVEKNTPPTNEENERQQERQNDEQKEDGKNLQAYENFLLRHERTVKRIQKEK